MREMPGLQYMGIFRRRFEDGTGNCRAGRLLCPTRPNRHGGNTPEIQL